MTDWDRYLPQVMGAYNSTQHSTTGVSPHMMLTGHEKSLPLTFFYPEYEGKKTSPQVYVRDVIRRQQELNDLCRRNTQQAQARQRKRFDKKAAGAKAYSVGDYVWVFQNVIPPQELVAKKMQAVTEEAREPEPATAADDFKIDYRAAARDAINRVQQELVTKEIEQKVKLELENEKLQEQLNAFEATEVEEANHQAA